MLELVLTNFHAAEMVGLVREPENAYDANAIRVENIAAEKVGHLNRQLAEQVGVCVVVGGVLMLNACGVLSVVRWEDRHVWCGGCDVVWRVVCSIATYYPCFALATITPTTPTIDCIPA